MNEWLVIIPAYNEQKNLIQVLKEIRELGLGLDIAVINDGSTDGTERVAKEAGVSVITLPYNLGYGGACQTGFKYAVISGYKYVIQFDADGQHDPEDIKKIMVHLLTGQADIIIGSRFLGRGNFKTGFLKLAAINIFRFMIRIATGIKITDPSSGLQGLTRKSFMYYASMGNYPADYPDADILINMLKLKFRINEFPANIRARYSGKSMHSGVKPLFYVLKMIVSIFVVLLRGKIKPGGMYHA